MLSSSICHFLWSLSNRPDSESLTLVEISWMFNYKKLCIPCITSKPNGGIHSISDFSNDFIRAHLVANIYGHVTKTMEAWYSEWLFSEYKFCATLRSVQVLNLSKKACRFLFLNSFCPSKYKVVWHHRPLARQAPHKRIYALSRTLL